MKCSYSSTIRPHRLIQKAIVLLAHIILFSSVQAQLFQPTQISALSQMKNNYGNAVADYDQDGDLDIFIVAYEGFESGEPKSWSRLLKNNGSALWLDATSSAGLNNQYQSNAHPDHKLGVSWGDFDNDGFPDLLLTHAGSIQLYHNQQDGTFKDISLASKLRSCNHCVNTSALWWDYNNDGYLDLYISDYENENRLFRNEQNGTFKDVSFSSKLGDEGSTWCSLAFDFNQDGWMDIYVVNDYGFSRMYLNNQGKDFHEATEEYGLINTGDAMGVSIGDYNNDGLFDIYVSNVSEFQPNPLFRGNPDGTFSNVQEDQKVGYANWAWGTHFFDADHDGDEDLYVVNGSRNFTYSNKFFKNTHTQGNPEFMDWSSEAACDGSAHGMALEVFDYDQDGDLDMLVSNTNDSPSLYNNVGILGNTNWLQIELEGRTSNRNAFGAKVKVSGKDRSYVRYHHGAGIMSQSIKPVHFGLGDLDMIDSIEVQWPAGQLEKFYQIPSNRKIKLIEGKPLEIEGDPNEQVLLPREFQLRRVFPNPFQDSFSLEIDVPRAGYFIFQLLSPSATLIYEQHGEFSAGRNQLAWKDGQETKSIMSAGMYFYRILWEGHVLTGKLWAQ
ncbi:MAG: CRTAC1 family protein [Bacteroidota bacterium]